MARDKRIEELETVNHRLQKELDGKNERIENLRATRFLPYRKWSR